MSGPQPHGARPPHRSLSPPVSPRPSHRYNAASLPEIGANHSKYGIQALYILDWTTCRLGSGCCGHASPDPSCCNSGCKPCASPLLHYGPTPCKSPRPDWRAYWNNTFATLQPYIANRSVIGVNLNDEMMCAAASSSDPHLLPN